MGDEILDFDDYDSMRYYALQILDSTEEGGLQIAEDCKSYSCNPPRVSTPPPPPSEDGYYTSSLLFLTEMGFDKARAASAYGRTGGLKDAVKILIAEATEPSLQTNLFKEP